MKMLTKKLTISWSVCSLLIIIYTKGASGQCTQAGRFGGRIGAICKHECHCAGSAECDKNTGACTRCAAGYYGDTCQKQNVALGRNASQSSTQPYIGNVAGLAVNGDTSTNFSPGHQCTHTAEEMNVWWYVDLVDEYNITSVQVYSRKACTDYSFGTDCNKRCHCKSETVVCDKVTGYCSSGCAAGYTGVDCQTECPMNTYGDCMASCSTHCNPVSDGTRQCNFISGDCPDTTGCHAGYTGAKCDQQCPMDFYGDCIPECSTYCLAVDVGIRRCDIISGNCTIKSGCKSGYIGARCDQKCPMGYYGDCKTSCSEHCIPADVRERQCNVISGHCTDTAGCQAGYTGPRCDQACPVNYYGDCTTSCSKHCLAVDDGKRHCNLISGDCTTGCQAGYTGSRCDQECTDYSFGLSCAMKCNCRYVPEVCNKPNGACLSGCPNGYYGADCQAECADRSFGLWCAERCNCMDETEACNKRTGACSSGCAAGFEGQDCKTVAAQERPADGLKIALIIIGGLLGLALVLALFVIYKQRRKYVKATQTKATLVGQLGQPTFPDLVHNIDANDAEKVVASLADIVIEYDMVEDDYYEIPQITTN